MDAELLARVASRLMRLSVWHLSTQQAEAILTRTLKGTSLKKLLLKHIQGEDLGLGLISAVEKVIPEVSIDKSDGYSYSDSVSESESYESGSYADSELESGDSEFDLSHNTEECSIVSASCSDTG